MIQMKWAASCTAGTSGRTRPWATARCRKGKEPERGMGRMAAGKSPCRLCCLDYIALLELRFYYFQTNGLGVGVGCRTNGMVAGRGFRLKSKPKASHMVSIKSKELCGVSTCCWARPGPGPGCRGGSPASSPATAAAIAHTASTFPFIAGRKYSFDLKIEF